MKKFMLALVMLVLFGNFWSCTPEDIIEETNSEVSATIGEETHDPNGETEDD